jgi:hypothetical protein
MKIFKYSVGIVFLPLFIILSFSVFAEEAPPVQAVNPINKKVLPADNPTKKIPSKPSINEQGTPALPAEKNTPEPSSTSPSMSPPITANSGQMKAKPLSDLNMKTGASGMTKKLEDPTRISDSFQSALKRLGPQTADATSTTTPAAVTVLPDIELAAIIDGYGKERTALIKLGKKTHMVREGYTFTEIKGNVVLEIYVEKIELCEIKLNVSPPNQLLILR